MSLRGRVEVAGDRHFCPPRSIGEEAGGISSSCQFLKFLNPTNGWEVNRAEFVIAGEELELVRIAPQPPLPLITSGPAVHQPCSQARKRWGRGWRKLLLPSPSCPLPPVTTGLAAWLKDSRARCNWMQWGPWGRGHGEEITEPNPYGLPWNFNYQ